MKKRIFTSVLFTAFLASAVHAQYFTLRVAGGYAFPGLTPTQSVMGPKIDPLSPDKDGLLPMSNINDSVPSVKSVYGSYGKGMNFTFSFGYMFNPYIGIDLGVSYLKSATISCDQTRQLSIQTGFGVPPSYSTVPYFMNAHIETHALGVSLMPSLVVKGAKPGWKVYPYGRVGISMPVFGKLEHDVNIDVDPSVFTEQPLLANSIYGSPYFLGKQTKVKLETEGTVSIGVNGAMGVAYSPIPLITISAELNGQYLVTRAKSAKITQWDDVKADGTVVNRIGDRGVYRTQFNFVDKLDNHSNNEDYNSATDKTKPKDDIRPTGPFSNLGFNIGVCINLSKEILQSFKDKKAKK
jgi:opacity protein-like surface antigen